MDWCKKNHEIVSLAAADTEVGLRLDVFLAKRLTCSRNAIVQNLLKPVCDALGKPLKWSHKIRRSEVIRFQRPINPEPAVTVQYRILFQDDCLVVLDKGPGVPVHPARSFRTRTVITHLRKQMNDDRLSPVHRLDRETSGVLIVGRAGALAALNKQFAQRSVSKTYLAVVRGSPAFAQEQVRDRLAPDREFPVGCRMKIDPQAGKLAVTTFAVLSRHQRVSLIQACPVTGRTHQIRVQLAGRGYPILGDKLYQEQGEAYLALIRDTLQPEQLERLGHHRLALHCSKIVLVHPENGQTLAFEAALPEDLQALLR